MLKFTAEIDARTIGDLQEFLVEIATRLDNDGAIGMVSGPDGRFYFELSGEEGEGAEEKE